jgi:glycylpeptide N-tetradecanoyltransferase
MPHGQRDAHAEGPIEPNKPVEEIRDEPYTMPAGFEWSNVNVNDPDQRLELYNLLAQNYVEDDECLFRFDYSQEFLLWALTPPGYRDDFLFGVRSSKTKKLVAFISGIPAQVQVYEKELPIVEINFLCVHKKLRSKRLAPVLIKEVTRRVNKTGVFQAVYTAGAVLPVPVSSSRYHHRNLNPKKLVKVGFTRLNPRQTMARMIKLYRLPDEPHTKGLRPMEKKDVDAVHKLLVAYLEKFHLKILFTKEEVAHWLLPRENVINSYVVESPEDGKITDFCSFYHLPSTIFEYG